MSEKKPECPWPINEETMAQESKVVRAIIAHAAKMKKQRDKLLAAARKILDKSVLDGGLVSDTSYHTFGPTINELLEIVRECQTEEDK